ncbi:DUF1329 domain-containing protein [Oceaniserpentilla sp. 4NH20-0058]|uniref:DUF1329 domain-containing protein n=1 Tax=Oceaniserpentilla sp. 4NH20-0058 TaxID=3127660 RepID=UPI00310B5BF1
MMKSGLLLSTILIVCGLSTSAHAQISAKEAAKLGTTLTPLGGDRTANADGSIPEWRGGIQFPPKAYKKPGQHHVNPFPSDKPLFVVTAQNIEQYEEFLTDGQKALFKTYPDTFKMPIYKTRRTAASPQWVYDNTYKNSTKAVLAEGGIGVKNSVGGIPFPIPKSSLEVMWNHITRYRGEYLVREGSEVAVHTDGSYVLITTKAEVLFNYYERGITEEELDNNFLSYVSFTKAPARLAGGAVLSHEYLNQVKQPRRAWGYNAGQRRVRKAPSLAYDTPIAAADGLRTVDDTDMYNGSPDRYDWKLVGKEEKYIPYNNYVISTPEVPVKSLLMPGHLNPDYARYEKHRVWVVEATLKPGKRHIYHKRRFYIDEDSWTIAVADQYDERGQLWRVSMAYLKNFYELPAILTCMDVFHDVLARRYHVQGMFNEEPQTIDFSQASPGSRYFSPQELRRRGR